MLKMFASVFGSIQVNLNHFPALHRSSQEVKYLYMVRKNLTFCVLLSFLYFIFHFFVLLTEIHTTKLHV